MMLYPRFIHRFISLFKYDFHPYDNPAGLFVWKWPSIGRPRIRPAKLFANLLLRQHLWFMIIPYAGRFLETSSIEHFPDFCPKIANWSSKLKMKISGNSPYLTELLGFKFHSLGTEILEFPEFILEMFLLN